MSDKYMEKLAYCQKKTGLTRADVIRFGIDKIYDELKNKKLPDYNQHNFLFVTQKYPSDKSIISDADTSFKNQNLKGVFLL